MVFPLVLAAIAERWIRRPLDVGIGVTAALFIAINTSASANSAVEQLFSLWTTSARLYPDPTDLLVLPVVAVAAPVWLHPLADNGKVRAAWGRFVLGLGIFASLATGASGLSIDDSGSFLLDTERPTARVEIAVQIDDEPDHNAFALETGFNSLGSTAAGDPSEAVAINRVVDGDVARYDFTLLDEAFAPVQIDWWVSGNLDQNTECAIVFFFCDDPPTLTYDVTAPEFDELEAPIVSFTPNHVLSQERPRFHRWKLDISSPAATPVLFLTSAFDAEDHQVVARVGDELLQLSPGQATAVPIPTGCTQRCEVDVLLSGSGNWDSPSTPFRAAVHLYDESGLTTARKVGNQLTRTPVAATLPDLPIATDDEYRYFRLDAEVSTWQPGSPFEVLLLTVDYVDLSGERRSETITVLPSEGGTHFIPVSCCHAPEEADIQSSLSITKAELVSFDPTNELPTVELSATIDN